jgi:hypothetical protein
MQILQVDDKQDQSNSELLSKHLFAGCIHLEALGPKLNLEASLNRAKLASLLFSRGGQDQDRKWNQGLSFAQ